MMPMQDWIEKNLEASKAIRPEATDLTTEQVIETLRGAIALLDERGWIQGSGCGPDDEVCAATSLSGAMLVAPGTPTFRYGRYQVVADAIIESQGIRRAFSMPNDSLIEWNDEPGRTLDEVKAAFQGTIDDLTEGRVRIENGVVAA